MDAPGATAVTLIAWALAGLIGLALGLLGGGGSILTVPVFTYVLGYEPKQAIAMSLPVVGAAAAAGAIAAFRRGTLPLGAAALLGPATMIGSYGGARLAMRMDGRTQLLLLAVVMLTASFAMWWRSRKGADDLVPASRPRASLVVAIGLAVGLLTGLVGIGGGFLIVPVLVIAAGVPMREATSASLLVIALGASSGLAGYLGRVDFDWNVVAVFAAVASVGAIAGGSVARRLSTKRLQQGFAGLLLVIAVYMLARS